MGGKCYCTVAAVGREEKRERAKWLIFHAVSGGHRHSERVQTASLQEGNYEFYASSTWTLAQHIWNKPQLGKCFLNRRIKMFDNKCHDTFDGVMTIEGIMMINKQQ